MAINSEGERGFILTATNSTFAKNQLDNRKGCLQHELILGGDIPETKTIPAGPSKQDKASLLAGI